MKLEVKGMAAKSHNFRSGTIAFLKQKGSATFTEIRNALGIDNDSYTAYHLNTMVRHGLVKKEGKQYFVTYKPQPKVIRHYLEVKRGEKVIERISCLYLSAFQVENKIEKVSKNIPSTYHIEKVSYPMQVEVGFFSDNLN